MSELNAITIPTYEEVKNAYLKIRDKVHRTPVLNSKKVNERAGGELFFKCENFQKVGAFKFRGATHAVGELSDEEAQNGVATHSSGNHAQAVALAAKLRGIAAHIVMPENAPKVKVNAVRDYGATITFSESTQEGREATLKKVVEETGATFIHPYDNPHIIMGQASAAIELLEEKPDLDYIIAPIGGGGLMSGTSIAASGLSPETKIIGTEPEVANDAYLSFKTSELHPVQSTDTVADGLRTSLSPLTFACIQEHVDAIYTVTEQEIIDAMRFIWERMKIIIEPSCAVPVAAVFNGKIDLQGKRAGIIITGGNMDLDQLPWQG
ncbi:pyridoxal-phosphate dependent enzyme [Fodinibius halophilus]|uniref:Pyridoxal-phosphate dependent enzyme n=1 Tax=Fodinibius halophilus TaxID=1736908 RepID=A0A6M1TD82_9BACT|nr:pyridoxal-phosphate dependent enzyme [Fodinibius halophilus]NGP88132.1 pyridoxal-phosphate dependent enzyme [Fodinibius halophilus]